ncbi:MAG TPA: methyltransferase domain-containing protein [Rhodopila sp.]
MRRFLPGRLRTLLSGESAEPQKAVAKFELRPPAPQNAVDIFAGKWASDLTPVCDVTGTGSAALFRDVRPGQAADSLGHDGRLDGFRLLELGPLEAAHSYQLEQLGASEIIAVEANTEAFLKCLVVKEILGLKNVRFLCGDIVAYLKSCTRRFDMIFCSGVLYHMSDPLELIRLMSLHTDKCFVWTHYFSNEASNDKMERTARTVSRFGFSATYHELEYPDPGFDRFWGGNRPVQAWMEKNEIFAAFAHFGFAHCKLLDEDPDHPAGRCMTFAAYR